MELAGANNMVLAEAQKIAAEKKIDEAYPYFVFLLDHYPKTEGLQEARQLYLFQAAGFSFGKGNYAEALGIIEELRKLNPDFRASPTSPTVMSDAEQHAADRDRRPLVPHPP